jgi:hypothetical protein
VLPALMVTVSTCVSLLSSASKRKSSTSISTGALADTILNTWPVVPVGPRVVVVSRFLSVVKIYKIFHHDLNNVQPHRGSRSSVIQQPGSLGWPQQFWNFVSLIKLFLTIWRNFTGQGRCERRLASTAFTLGFFFFSIVHNPPVPAMECGGCEVSY